MLRETNGHIVRSGKQIIGEDKEDDDASGGYLPRLGHADSCPRPRVGPFLGQFPRYKCIKIRINCRIWMSPEEVEAWEPGRPTWPSEQLLSFLPPRPQADDIAAGTAVRSQKLGTLAATPSSPDMSQSRRSRESTVRSPEENTVVTPVASGSSSQVPDLAAPPRQSSYLPLIYLADDLVTTPSVGQAVSSAETAPRVSLHLANQLEQSNEHVQPARQTRSEIPNSTRTTESRSAQGVHNGAGLALEATSASTTVGTTARGPTLKSGKDTITSLERCTLVT